MRKVFTLTASPWSGDWIYDGRLFVCCTVLGDLFSWAWQQHAILVEVRDEPFDDAIKIIFESCDNKDDCGEQSFCITLPDGSVYDELYCRFIEMCCDLKREFGTNVFYVRVSPVSQEL